MRFTPRVERTCLCCQSTFEGTPAATRCPSCKAAGLRAPSKRSARPDRALKRTCRDCGVKFILEPGEEKACRCVECAERFLDATLEKAEEELAAEREEKRRKRVKDRLERQAAWLTARAAKPKGRPGMTAATAKTPIGQLWLGLCAADGAASSILYAGHTTGLSDAETLALLTAYFRLRRLGRHPTALAKLCPAALLREETQAAIEELPEVTESEPEDDPDPYGGFSSDQIEDLLQYHHDQDRRADAIALGLS